jgi:hypothetical protein
MGTSGIIEGYETRMQIVLEEKAVYEQSYSKTVGLQSALENGDTGSGTDISITFMNHAQQQHGDAAVMHSGFGSMANLLSGAHMETMVAGAAQSMLGPAGPAGPLALGLGPRFGARQRSDSRVPKIDI